MQGFDPKLNPSAYDWYNDWGQDHSDADYWKTPCSDSDLGEEDTGDIEWKSQTLDRDVMYRNSVNRNIHKTGNDSAVFVQGSHYQDRILYNESIYRCDGVNNLPLLWKHDHEKIGCRLFSGKILSAIN